jgi:hypothetical protein
MSISTPGGALNRTAYVHVLGVDVGERAEGFDIRDGAPQAASLGTLTFSIADGVFRMSVFQTVAKKGILDAWGWLADDFRVVAVDSAYTFDSAHNFLDDVTDRVGISSLLASKTSTDGNAVSANPTITGPVTGPIAGCWLFRDTGWRRPAI